MSLVAAAIFIALGVGVVFWMNRRAFNRRNVAGVQEFNSYSHSLVIRTLERIGHIAGWLFILAGLGGLLTALIAGR